MSQERERDVIVVGAGPSGATAATFLAQQGHDVLLLDRDNFPRDKACGDGIPAGVFRIMRRLGMGDKIAGAEARGELYRVTGMRITSPKGNVIAADFEVSDGNHSCVSPRTHFDAIIQQHAVESGAEFRLASVKAPLLENGRVVGVQVQANGSTVGIRSKVVVGADGVTSVIARGLRPKEKRHKDEHRAIALRAYIRDLEVFPRQVEFFLYNEILPGYAWIFPTGDGEANIGLGMRLDRFRQLDGDLKQMLQTFLGLPDIRKRVRRGGEIDKVRTWQLNFGSQKNLQNTYDGAILIGDAAGLINPMTGGGIHNSMISAELAAQTIDEALAVGDTSRGALKIFEQRTQEELWPSMKRSYFMQRWLLRFPSLVDFLIVRAQENGSIAQTFLAKL
jgi:geranylgeranyl reductase family protein